MITDVQLAIFANKVGMSVFLPVVLYHNMTVNNPQKQEGKWRFLHPRVPGHSLRQDRGCEWPSHFTSSLLPITICKATTPGFFQTTFISSKSSLSIRNKKLPLNRTQYRGWFSTASPTPNTKLIKGSHITISGAEECTSLPLYVEICPHRPAWDSGLGWARVHHATGGHPPKLRLQHKTASSDQQTTTKAKAWPTPAYANIHGTQAQEIVKLKSEAQVLSNATGDPAFEEVNKMIWVIGADGNPE
nr:uncharacterized protein LOC114087788 [Marmota flaviventris]